MFRPAEKTSLALTVHHWRKVITGASRRGGKDKDREKTTQRVDNLHVIDCSCAAVILIHSVTHSPRQTAGRRRHGGDDASGALGLNSIISASAERLTQSTVATVNYECVIQANPAAQYADGCHGTEGNGMTKTLARNR